MNGLCTDANAHKQTNSKDWTLSSGAKKGQCGQSCIRPVGLCVSGS